MPHPIIPRAKDKPAKLYPDFLLFPHSTARRAKTIRGQFHQFGLWAYADAAPKEV